MLQRIQELQHERWRQSLLPGQTPGPEMMLGKLHNQAFNRQLVPLLTEVLGSRLEADTGGVGAWAWTQYVLSTPGMRIGGGTEEIVKNTVAERVLGLPKEPQGVTPPRTGADRARLPEPFDVGRRRRRPPRGARLGHLPVAVVGSSSTR